MLELTGFLGLTRISFFLLTQIPLYCFVGGKSHRCFCVWAGSRGFRLVFGLTRIPRYCFVGGKSHRCFCAWVARADSTLLLGSHGSHFLGSHGSHRSHSIALWVGNLTDGSVGVGSWGLHGARSHGLIFWTLRTNQTYRTNRTDWTFLKIIHEICGICVRPPWDWDLCEASVDSVGAGDKITKNCVIWGAFWKIWKKSVEKVATLRNFCKLCVLIIKKCVGLLFFLPLF